jgi:two-component system sensor histidine kinase YesM
MYPIFLKFLHRLSFKNRIRAAFMCILIFAVATTGGVSYYIVSNVMEEQALKQSQDTLNKTSQVLDEKLRKILLYSMTFTMSQPFKDLLSDLGEQDSSDYYKHFSALQPLFDQFTLNERAIDSVLISSAIGDFYSTTKWRLVERPFKSTILYREMGDVLSKQRIYWSEEHPDELFSEGNRVISLVFEPFPQREQEDIHIIVNVNARAIHDLIVGPYNEVNRVPYLLTGNKTSVFNAQLELLESSDLTQMISSQMEDSFVFEHKKEEYLINYAKIQGYPDWTIVTAQPKSELLSLIAGIRWNSIIIVLICALLTLYITNVLTSYIFRPLTQLQYLMNRIGQNNLHLRFHSEYNDELTQMGEKFNNMLDEINLLMERNSKIERDKHIAEVKALQAQINPHFLYNSLNMVFLKCMDNQYDKAKEMVVSLSKLFELGLNNGLEGTTVGRELEHVKYYMKIQQACYRGLFEYRIHVQDPSLLLLPIMNLLLQPLVENSIMHGFKNRPENGEINIYVTRNGNLLSLTVEDNGCGMNVEQAYRRMKDVESDSYALRNVFDRLKLYGGERAQFIFTSDPYVSTRVRIVLPVHSPGGIDIE